MKVWMCLSAVAVAATAANAGLIRQFDAALDPAGDNVWANTGTLNAGQGNNFTFASPQTAAVVNDPIAFGITRAYEIGTTGAIAGANWSFWGQAGGGRANPAENTFEVFFRVDNLTGTHLIMEIGGAGAGVSLGIDGGSLVWASNPGGNADPTVSVSTGITTGWHHAVGVWNRNTLTTGLYLDGQFVGDVALAASTTGWVGGNEASLGGYTGNPDGSAAASIFDNLALTDFDGAIAAFNYYNEELSAQAILDNYNAVFIPAPGTAALLGLGLLVARRRR